MAASPPAGGWTSSRRKLHREVNTMGSKSQRAEIAGRVIEAKAELERLREQVQNLE